jgi:hypothetical protein
MGWRRSREKAMPTAAIVVGDGYSEGGVPGCHGGGGGVDGDLEVGEGGEVAENVEDGGEEGTPGMWLRWRETINWSTRAAQPTA